MAPYSGTAAVLLVIVISVVFGGNRSATWATSKPACCSRAQQTQPDEIRITGYGAGYGGWRTIVYSLLFTRLPVLAVST